jgi:hypothetical protein
MRHSNLQAVNAFNIMPLSKRLALLAESVLEHETGAVAPVAALIAVAATMASFLSPAQKLEIAHVLRCEADGLDAPDRCALN